MKTKTTSKRIALLGSALLALSIFAPAVVEAVPITLSLDNPNQSVVHPSSGTVTLSFTGTIIIELGFAFNPPGDVLGTQPFNFLGTHHLGGAFTGAFVTFVNDHRGIFTGGTFTGTIFDTFVTPGDPPDLYAFSGGGPGFNQPADLFLRVADQNNQNETVAREAFSVQVTGVPDRGSSILLLGLSLAALCSVNALKRVAA